MSSARRANVGFALRLPGGEAHLLECGPTTYPQLLRFGLDPLAVTHVFLTHQHGDHTLGLPMLNNARWYLGSQRTLHVHGPEEALAAVRQASLVVYPDHRQRLESLVRFHAHASDRIERDDVSPSLRVTSAPNRHSVPGIAYRFDLADGTSFVYSGDTAASEAVVELAAGAGLLLHDATCSRRVAPELVSGDHATAHDAGQVAARAGVARLGLVHLAPQLDGREDDLAEEARECFPGPVFVPTDGDVLALTPRAGPET